MQRTKWFEPYFPPAKTGGKFRAQMKGDWGKGTAGVYFIRHKATKAVVYVGMSTGQLKKTIYRHFQDWNDKTRNALWGSSERKSYPKAGYELRFIETTPQQAQRLEKYYIGKLEPKDNAEKYKEYFKAETEAQTAANIAQVEEWDEEIIRSPFFRKPDYLEEPPF